MQGSVGSPCRSTRSAPDAATRASWRVPGISKRTTPRWPLPLPLQPPAKHTQRSGDEGEPSAGSFARQLAKPVAGHRAASAWGRPGAGSLRSVPGSLISDSRNQPPVAIARLSRVRCRAGPFNQSGESGNSSPKDATGLGRPLPAPAQHHRRTGPRPPQGIPTTAATSPTKTPSATGAALLRLLPSPVSLRVRRTPGSPDRAEGGPRR
jgi:hypothetical protein